MSTNALERKIISYGEKRNMKELSMLVEKTNTTALIGCIKTKLGQSGYTTLWNYLLESFGGNNSSESIEKRFACVMAFLARIREVELRGLEAYDLIMRLCQDLHTFPGAQLVKILEHCMDDLRTGDPKCISWKDLLPETLKVLAEMDELNVNGVMMSGNEYRDTIIRNICTMRWPNEVLTPIADMVKELDLKPSELLLMLNKFSSSLHSLAPMELPALAYQLFSMCSTATLIIVPLLALDKYFNRLCYNNLCAEKTGSVPDLNSIDTHSESELREAEETVLHHLNYCSQYKISENQMCFVLRNFTSMPDVILSPFLLGAILSMTAANREPNARFTHSVLLPFLRSVINNNEEERCLTEYSLWCRDTLQQKLINIEQIFDVMIEQNKEGKDVVTPGLVNLVFSLLRSKHYTALHKLAIGFLTRFIRKRFIFGQGIVKKLCEWMVVQQDQLQYSECLTNLSIADGFTVSECLKSINYVLDSFLLLPGDQALRMMSFLLPLLKISPVVRDALIEVLRKAMSSSDMRIGGMAVYGFCMILKQLNNSNAQRSQMMNVSTFCTQQRLTGWAMLSQATLSNRSHPQRHFTMLTLEIMSVLRGCFDSCLDIKLTLYENLQRAVELNNKLLPHVLQFIDWHFRSYFIISDSAEDIVEFSVQFEKALANGNDDDCDDVMARDNIGRLVQFVSYCLEIFEKCPGEYHIGEIKRILDVAVEKVVMKELPFEPLIAPYSSRKNQIGIQQINFIEGLMAYTILTSSQDNDKIKHLLPLFKEHQHMTENLKNLTTSSKKNTKKTKNANEKTSTIINKTSTPPKKAATNDNINIWDLCLLEKLLHLLCDGNITSATSKIMEKLRSSCALRRYVFQVACYKIEAIRLEPEYKQLKHSRRILHYLTQITKIIYECCIKALPELWTTFDLTLAAYTTECFQQCLLSADQVYKRKFVDIFLPGFDVHTSDNDKKAPEIVQDVIDEIFKAEQTDRSDDDTIKETPEGRKIVSALLQCLEVLYDNISYNNRLSTESYLWLLKFCTNNELDSKEFYLVHKLLFVQRQKTHSGAFFDTVAMHVQILFGCITDEEENTSSQEILSSRLSFRLKSITTDSIESCLGHLYATLRKQIEDVEYFIAKANNLAYKYRLLAEEDHSLCLTSLQSLERSICTQLVHISKTLLHLTNACLPLGIIMDGLLRLLRQHYICLKNLTKHYLNNCAHIKVSLHSTKFKSLLHVVGKPLSSNIYALITYIDGNTLQDQSKKKKYDAQAAKAKVMRDTKMIPKIILCLENFNKHVIFLSKKTNDRLTRLLHDGMVRDFRIKESLLKAAIKRTNANDSQMHEGDATDDEQNEKKKKAAMEEEASAEEETAEAAAEDEVAAETEDEEAENDEDNDHVDNAVRNLRRSCRRGVCQTIDDNQSSAMTDNDENGKMPSPEDVLPQEEKSETSSQLLRNLAKVNKNAKARKRSLKESENCDPDVNSAQPMMKKRRGRSAKK